MLFSWQFVQNLKNKLTWKSLFWDYMQSVLLPKIVSTKWSVEIDLR